MANRKKKTNLMQVISQISLLCTILHYCFTGNGFNTINVIRYRFIIHICNTVFDECGPALPGAKENKKNF